MFSLLGSKLALKINAFILATGRCSIHDSFFSRRTLSCLIILLGRHRSLPLVLIPELLDWMAFMFLDTLDAFDLLRLLHQSYTEPQIGEYLQIRYHSRLFAELVIRK